MSTILRKISLAHSQEIRKLERMKADGSKTTFQLFEQAHLALEYARLAQSLPLGFNGGRIPTRPGPYTARLSGQNDVSGK